MNHIDISRLHGTQWEEKTHLVFDEGGERKVIKEVGEVSPNVGVAVFSQALVIEAIHLRDLSGFVVSAEDSDTVPETQLECYEEGDSLDRVIASIDVVAHEEVVCVW